MTEAEREAWDEFVSGDVTPAERRLGLLLHERHRPLIARRNTVVGLTWESPWWIGEVDRHFRPEGLLITDAPPGALVCEWRNGIYRDIPMGNRPVALATFELLSRLDVARVQPHFHPLMPGERIFIRTTTADAVPLGPPLGLTVWGIFAETY